MKEAITTTSIAAGTGFFAWLFGKMQTRREKKKSDLQLISEAVSPLVQSIKDLTEQNNEIISKLMKEQDKVLQLMSEKSALINERGELLEKIEKLEKQVHCLTKKINELVKSDK